MRAIVLSLVLGLSALGSLAIPSSAQAQPVPGFYAARGPAPFWRGGSHYRWRGGSHYRYLRPGGFCRPYVGVSPYAGVRPYYGPTFPNGGIGVSPGYPSLGGYGGYPGGLGGLGGYGPTYSPYYP